ncbi:hypothetical protein O1M54_34350 [Streptomyces diastatochromogenes]|nr:hypothetical protein [Streptomyces diastatochromogenes]
MTVGVGLGSVEGEAGGAAGEVKRGCGADEVAAGGDTGTLGRTSWAAARSRAGGWYANRPLAMPAAATTATPHPRRTAGPYGGNGDAGFRTRLGLVRWLRLEETQVGGVRAGYRAERQGGLDGR